MNLLNYIEELDCSWKNILKPLWYKYGSDIEKNILDDLSKYNNELNIYPEINNIFTCFRLCPFDKINVVILGMDPYINKNEAHGLAFSVKDNIKCPPSLRNIFKELKNSHNIDRYNTDLTDWAIQGVLLLNTSLTVREGASGSHIKIWYNFMDELIKYIFTNQSKCVFMLWGNHAKNFSSYINDNDNLVLTHTHPSPLSRKPFIGCNHFILCDKYLEKNKNITIFWN